MAGGGIGLATCGRSSFEKPGQSCYRYVSLRQPRALAEYLRRAISYVAFGPTSTHRSHAMPKPRPPCQPHLIAHAPSGPFRELDVARWRSMTGLLRGELLALRWSDVDWLAAGIRLRRNSFSRREPDRRGPGVREPRRTSEHLRPVFIGHYA